MSPDFKDGQSGTVHCIRSFTWYRNLNEKIEKLIENQNKIETKLERIEEKMTDLGTLHLNHGS